MSPPLPDLKDRTVGRYRVLGPLGRGGMGLVYRAEDPRLGRAVALKLLPEPLSGDPRAQARLDAEARAASQLDHPNICTVYEVGETDDGHLFLAMACYDGQTLAEALTERGVFPVEEAVSVARQVAAGLAAAHRRDIVHRDLKPSNVFLCADEDGHGPRARILDFGVAKVAGVDLTEAGGTVGTVAYAAPEQARGERVDGRADLWALGVVLYEMLAGRRPFEAVYEAALLNAIQFEAPAPLRTHRPEVPEAVEAVVMRLLEKDPADRFQTAAEVEAALGEALTHPEAVPPRRRRPRARRPLFWSAGGLLLLLVLAFALSGVLRSGPPPLPEERHIAVLPFTVAGEDASSHAFADGLGELVVSELIQLKRYEGALEVVPMSEVRTQGIESAGEARHALGATLVVTGRVDRDSTGAAVTINLEDATTLRQLDARTLRRPTSELDALQGDVVATLVQMLDVELQPEARAALAAGGTRSSAAFEAYVHGLGFLEGATPEAAEQAVTAFEQAIYLDARFALAYARLGEAALQVYQETKQPDWITRAEAAIERAIALNPDEPLGYVTRAQLYTTTGRYDEAVGEARRALTLDPASDAAYGALARAYDASGDAAAAETAYREAIAREPGAWRGYNNLGLFYYNHGRPADALQAWQRVTRLAPDLARGYSNVGAAYYSLNRPDSAFAMFEHAIALYPSYAALSNLATLYYAEGRYADAARTYRRALDLDDHDHLAWGSLAAAYERLDEHDKAVGAYHEAIHRAEAEHTVNPQDPVPLAHLANYYVSVTDSARARTAVEEAAAFDPESGETAFYIGLAYEQLGERNEALRWISHALAGGYAREEVENTHALAALVGDSRYAALAGQSLNP